MSPEQRKGERRRQDMLASESEGAKATREAAKKIEDIKSEKDIPLSDEQYFEQLSDDIEGAA